VALVAGIALLLSACGGGLRLSPYRIDIRQGNLVTQDMVSRLKPGMTKDQVRFALGTPLVADVFHGQRWDYVYEFRPGRGEVQHRRLTVHFEDGKLVRVSGDVEAAGAGESTEASEAARRNQVVQIEGPPAPESVASDAPKAPEPAASH
jgi:outer membrane protein assembly factor BamE